MAQNDWLQLAPLPPAPFIETGLAVLDPFFTALSGLLGVVEAILDVLAFINTLLADPLAAVALALVTEISKMIDSMIALSFGVFVYTPPSWDTETAKGYSDFVQTISASLDDPGDRARPRLGDETPFWAVAFASGSKIPLEILGYVEKLSVFLTAKFFKVRNQIFTVIPQALNYGVVKGLEVSVATEGTSLTVAAGKILYGPLGILEVNAPLNTTYAKDFEPNKVYIHNVFAIQSPNILILPKIYAIATPIGDVRVLNAGSPNETRDLAIDVALLSELGNTTVFLAYFETDSTGKVTSLNPNYRRTFPGLNEEEIKDEAKQTDFKSVPPDWVGWSVGEVDWFQPVFEWLNKATKQAEPQHTINDSLNQLQELLNAISQDLQDVSQALKDTALDIQQALDFAGQTSFLYLTPWPSIMTDKDPFIFEPNDAFTLEADFASSITGSPSGPMPFIINATTGSYVGSDSAAFDIVAGAAFSMDVYLRRSRPLVGSTAAYTLGFDTGSESPLGVYNTGDARKFKVPTAGGGLKISTFGTGIEAISGTALNLLGIPVSSSELFLTSTAPTFKYHIPTGASFNISLWTGRADLDNPPNSVLPYLGLGSASYSEEANKILGDDALSFKVPSTTDVVITTRTTKRSYLPSPLKASLGLNTLVTAGLVDTGIDTRYLDIPSLGGYRLTLAIRSLSVTSGLARTVLGLDTYTSGHGFIVGEPSFLFTYPAETLALKTYINKIQNMSGNLADLTKWGLIPSAKTSITGIDTRLFSWQINSGFTLNVKNIGGTIFSGTCNIAVTATDRNGLTLANQVTFAIRNMVGARGLETCTYEPNGTFKFYFGNDVTEVIITNHPNPAKDLLKALGLSATTYIPVSYFINGSDPEIYAVTGLGNFKYTLGKTTYTSYVPLGVYSGAALASLLQTSITAVTLKSETVAYNSLTGRFTLTLDPAGYLSFDDVLEVTTASIKDSLDILVELNSQVLGDGSLVFRLESGAFTFAQDGLVSINLDLPFEPLGFSAGDSIASSEKVTFSTPKNYRFSAGEGVLTLSLNKLPTVLTFPEDINLSYGDLQSHFSVNYPAITLSQVGLSLKLYSNTNRELLTNYLFFYPSPTQNHVDVEAADLKDRFDTALGDVLTTVSYSNDTFNIDYPALDSLTFTTPGIGLDLGPKFGFIDLTNLTGSYTGSEVSLYEITAGLDFLSLTLGSVNQVATIPVNTYTPTSLKAALNSALSLLGDNPTASYNPATGSFSLTHPNTGYIQINNQTLTLASSPSTYTGSQFASLVQTQFRALTGAVGLETVLWLAGKFIISCPDLRSITFSAGSNLSLILPLGFGYTTYTIVGNRVEGLEPAPFFIEGPVNKFNYGLDPSYLLVTIPDSVEYESGIVLAGRIQTELQTITGGAETVAYNNAFNRFEVTPDPTGFQVLNAAPIVLAGSPAYKTRAEFALDVSAVLNTALTGLGLIQNNNTFRFEYPEMVRLELTAGGSGLALEELLGFSLTIYTDLDGFLNSDQPLKPYAIQASNNTLVLRLGGVTHTLTLTTTGLLEGEGLANALQAELQAASGRQTLVTYEPLSEAFQINVDPLGEKLVVDFPVVLTDNYYSPANVKTYLDPLSAYTGSTGSETFILFGDHFQFQDTSGRTLALNFNVNGALFDLREPFGLLGSPVVSGLTDLDPWKFWIISLNENDLVRFDLNTVVYDFELPAGVYDENGIIAALNAEFTAELEEITYAFGVFTITSNPDGFLYSTDLITLPAVSGDGLVIAAILQAAIQTASAEGDELITFANLALTETKPDLIALEFHPHISSNDPDILSYLGLTPNYRFVANVGNTVTFDEMAPYKSITTANAFTIRVDNILAFDVELPTALLLSGTAMAELMQERIRGYLVGQILKDILYEKVNNLPLVFIDSPTYINSFVSNHHFNALEKQLIDILFQALNTQLQNDLQFSFPQTIDIPLISEALNALQSIVNSHIPASIAKIADKYTRDKAKLLLQQSLIELSTLATSYIDPDPDIFKDTVESLYTIAITNASTNLGFPITNDIKTSIVDLVVEYIQTLFTEKYFYNFEVVYLTSTNNFLLTSPTKGNYSRVEILPALANDITNHLGIDTGVESVGTGNVAFSHCVTSHEVRDIAGGLGFDAISFGNPSFRLYRDVLGVSTSADYRYPHRFYMTEELPWAADVFLGMHSLNMSTATLTLTDTVGSPLSTLGLPSGPLTALKGKSGFVGAFNQAGSFDPKLANDGFVFAAVGVIAVPDVTAAPQFVVDFTKKTAQSFATMFGLPDPNFGP